MQPETLQEKLEFIIVCIDHHIEEGWSPRSVLQRVMEEYIQEYHPKKDYSMSPPQPGDLDPTLMPSTSHPLSDTSSE